MVSSYDSQFLIDMINPIYTFSGDDHDFCSVTHNLRHPEVCKYVVVEIVTIYS